MIQINYFHNVDAEKYEALITKVLNKAAELEGVSGSVNIVFMNNEEIKEYNTQYRSKDYATDVLSFVDGEFDHLGDILISMEKCEEQAKEYHHSFEREIAFLACHGFLHLCGHDHMTQEDEVEMIRKQNEVLESLNITR